MSPVAPVLSREVEVRDHVAVTRQLPTGTVTFLFTDIEGSTRLLHDLGPERYAEALEQHRLILRSAFTAHGGVEVDTQGDAFFVAFQTAEGALAAARDAQEGLAEGPIRVRAAIHTGTPHVTAEGYVGVDVHQAARIAATGHGGQVLVSAAAATELMIDGLLDLGEHRLKDFDDAVSIYQLGAQEFPALKTISNTNLPRPASSFVGRQQEVDEIASLLRDGTRFLTLTGPGGSGKTRLAIEAAAELMPEFKAGVFWVGLASLSEAPLVTEAIAQTLGAKDSLAKHIGERELLLLLDNFEHLIEAASEVALLAESCPNLKLLITSRERLRVRGEIDYPVLPLPDYESVELFCARAQTEPDEMTGGLCRALDNLPLAIELAAARVSVFSPRQILERLSKRLDMLKGGRDADPRQQTLRATIDWSYELLSDEEQRLLACLAVFRGGCTLQAAEEVADAELDALQSLVDKSLVRHNDERFWMLETIREYAAERLERRQQGEDLRAGHARWCLALAEGAEPLIWGGQEPALLERLEAEHDNCRAALAWTRDTGRVELSLRLAIALSAFWEARGYVQEADKWLSELAGANRWPSRIAQAKALRWIAVFAWLRRDLPRAKASAVQSIAIFRELGDARWLARTILILGNIANAEGRKSEARSLYEETAITARKAEDLSCLALAVGNLGDLLLQDRNPEAARPLIEESLALFETLGEKEGVAFALVNLGSAASAEGAADEAKTLFHRALRISLELGFKAGIVNGLEGLAKLAATQGKAERAAQLLGAAMGLLESTGLSLDSLERAEHDRTSATARASLGEDLFDSMIRSGKQMGIDEAVTYALEEERATALTVPAHRCASPSDG